MIPENANSDRLTELEGAVLGMIAVRGPCTPYVLRREFTDSPSRFWSASSGAVYPLVRRLATRGLIRVARKTRDGREGSLYALTPAGSTALAEWVSGLDQPESISVPPDPLRSRVAFFEVLEPARREEAVVRAIDALKDHLERTREYTESERARGNRFETLISQGAQRMVETRLVWLNDVLLELRACPHPSMSREDTE